MVPFASEGDRGDGGASRSWADAKAPGENGLGDDLCYGGYQRGFKAYVTSPWRRGHFLAIRRDSSANDESLVRWDIPGGRQKVAESPVQALRREIEEEEPRLQFEIPGEGGTYRCGMPVMSVQVFNICGSPIRVVRHIILVVAANPDSFPFDGESTHWMSHERGALLLEENLRLFFVGLIERGE